MADNVIDLSKFQKRMDDAKTTKEPEVKSELIVETPTEEKPKYDSIIDLNAKAPAGKLPEFNMENVTVYEIDLRDDVQDLMTIDEETRNNILAENDKFLNTVVKPHLIQLCAPCACRQQEIIQKHLRRCQLMNLDPNRTPMTMDKDDFNMYKFGVVITSDNNVYVGVSAIVKECAKCHHIDMWGDASVITHIIATGTESSIQFKNEVSDFYNEDRVENPVIDVMDAIKEQYGEDVKLEPIDEGTDGGVTSEE